MYQAVKTEGEINTILADRQVKPIGYFELPAGKSLAAVLDSRDRQIDSYELLTLS
jgi:hypothetical protein